MRIEIEMPDDLTREAIERFENDLKEFLSERLREFGSKVKVINHATGDESTVYPVPICPECGRPLRSIDVNEFGRSLLFNHETGLYGYDEGKCVKQVYKCPECGKVIGEWRADGGIWGFVPVTE